MDADGFNGWLDRLEELPHDFVPTFLTMNNSERERYGDVVRAMKTAVRGKDWDKIVLSVNDVAVFLMAKVDALEAAKSHINNLIEIVDGLRDCMGLLPNYTYGKILKQGKDVAKILKIVENIQDRLVAVEQISNL
ncbi:MAG: hypothetical protein LBC70_03285 [Chitinispirillales bacterium]|jgi:hypothetical protein|nr:hypothetical protein [Chitinispirillales bacterium]